MLLASRCTCSPGNAWHCGTLLVRGGFGRNLWCTVRTSSGLSGPAKCLVHTEDRDRWSLPTQDRERCGHRVSVVPVLNCGTTEKSGCRPTQGNVRIQRRPFDHPASCTPSYTACTCGRDIPQAGQCLECTPRTLRWSYARRQHRRAHFPPRTCADQHTPLAPGDPGMTRPDTACTRPSRSCLAGIDQQGKGHRGRQRLAERPRQFPQSQADTPMLVCTLSAPARPGTCSLDRSCKESRWMIHRDTSPVCTAHRHGYSSASARHSPRNLPCTFGQVCIGGSPGYPGTLSRGRMLGTWSAPSCPARSRVNRGCMCWAGWSR